MLNAKSVLFIFAFIGLITFSPKSAYGADFPQVTKLSPSGTARFVPSSQLANVSNQTILLASIRDQLEVIRIRFQEILKVIKR